MLLLLLMEITVWKWFATFTWSKALTVVSILGGCASAIMPYLDAGQFRFLLFLFIAVSLQLQNIGHKEQIKALSQKISSTPLSAQPTVDPLLPSNGTTP
jgi:hypothetical protein